MFRGFPITVWARQHGPSGGNAAWLLTATALVLFMILPGLTLFDAGLVRLMLVSIGGGRFIELDGLCVGTSGQTEGTRHCHGHGGGPGYDYPGIRFRRLVGQTGA